MGGFKQFQRRIPYEKEDSDSDSREKEILTCAIPHGHGRKQHLCIIGTSSSAIKIIQSPATIFLGSHEEQSIHTLTIFVGMFSPVWRKLRIYFLRSVSIYSNTKYRTVFPSLFRLCLTSINLLFNDKRKFTVMNPLKQREMVHTISGLGFPSVSEKRFSSISSVKSKDLHLLIETTQEFFSLDYFCDKPGFWFFFVSCFLILSATT